MAKVKVHAANFPYTEISITSGAFFIKEGMFQFNSECVLANKIKTIDMASEDSVKKVGGALGWGVAGGVLLGPIGAIAGIFLGGNKKEVTFIVELDDDRKFMGTTDTKSYTKVVAKKIEYDSFNI